MARNKILSRKLRYGSEMKSSKSVPTWITIKTKRKVRQSPKQRHWRTSKIKR